MGPIQRYPLGLLEALDIKGLPAPANLNETIVPSIDMMQFYGNAQRQLLSASSGALARGVVLSCGIPPQWCILYSWSAQLTKTATMTSATLSLFASGPFATANVDTQYFSLGGVAPAVDGTWRMSAMAPYPILVGPNTNFFVILDQCTDANAAVAASFSIGVLG